MPDEPLQDASGKDDVAQTSVAAVSVLHQIQDEDADAGSDAKRNRYVVFELAEHLAAFPVSCVREIERVPTYTVLPHTPPWCLGVTNIRDEMVSVTDLAALVRAAKNRKAKEPKVIILFGERSRATTAVVVDRVIGIRSLNHHVADLPENTDSPLATLAVNVYQTSSSEIFLIDPDRFFAHPDMQPFMKTDRNPIHSPHHRTPAL